MTKLVGFLRFEGHGLVALHLSTFRHQNHRVLAWVPVTVVDEKVGERLDVEGMLWDDASIRGASHRWEQRSVAGITTKDLDHQKPLV